MLPYIYDVLRVYETRHFIRNVMQSNLRFF